MSLIDVFAAAVDGRLPAPDGQLEVSDAVGKAAAVVAFPAHFYIVAPVDPQWVRAQLPPGDYAAPLGARFVTALADRIGAQVGSHDAVLGTTAHGKRTVLALNETTAAEHPRVRRARAYREQVRTWRTSDETGYLVLGRGLAGRWEVAYEVEPAARGQGVGRALAAAALGLLPAGTPVFAQVPPGNSLSMRATLAAGYRPICGEVLLPLAPTTSPRGGLPAPAPEMPH